MYAVYRYYTYKKQPTLIKNELSLKEAQKRVALYITKVKAGKITSFVGFTKE